MQKFLNLLKFVFVDVVSNIFAIVFPLAIFVVGGKHIEDSFDGGGSLGDFAAFFTFLVSTIFLVSIVIYSGLSFYVYDKYSAIFFDDEVKNLSMSKRLESYCVFTVAIQITVFFLTLLFVPFGIVVFTLKSFLKYGLVKHLI